MMSPRRIADDPLATIKRRPSIRDVKDSEVLWLVAEVDRLREALQDARDDLTGPQPDPIVALAGVMAALDQWVPTINEPQEEGEMDYPVAVDPLPAVFERFKAWWTSQQPEPQEGDDHDRRD